MLLESWSKTTETEGTSVNQPEAEGVPPANAVPSPGEEAGPVAPYPYQPDEMIGGDCVNAIQHRLLAKYSSPSSEQAKIDAEDLFEIKVEIIRIMDGLDPRGDWPGRGARALDNPRTATGEESLETLYKLRDALSGAEGEERFWDTALKLRKKMFFLRRDPPQNSSS